MSSLSHSLTSLNPSQKLHVLRGSPEKVLPVVWREWGVTHLVFEKVCFSHPCFCVNVLWGYLEWSVGGIGTEGRREGEGGRCRGRGGGAKKWDGTGSAVLLLSVRLMILFACYRSRRIQQHTVSPPPSPSIPSPIPRNPLPHLNPILPISKTR